MGHDRLGYVELFYCGAKGQGIHGEKKKPYLVYVWSQQTQSLCAQTLFDCGNQRQKNKA